MAPSPTSRDPARASSGARIPGLDALRAGALLLGIVLHAMMPYSPTPMWIIQDDSVTDLVPPGVATIHLFRMTLFMLLAGYFGRLTVQRRGGGTYLRERLVRIALPAVAFWPIAVLPVGLVGAAVWARSGKAPPAPPPGESAITAALTPAHLWFLVVLTQVVLVTVLVRAVALRVLGPERPVGLVSRAGWWLTAPGGVVLAAVPYAATLALQGTTVGGLHSPESYLGSVSAFVAYAGAFWVGWAMHATSDGLRRAARGWPVHLAAAVVLTPVAIALPYTAAPLGVQAVVTALAGWAWTYGLVGSCVRLVRRERAWVRYVADASYWMYLVHLPVVLGVGALLLDLRRPALVKLAVVLALTVPLLLASYEVLVRHTWVGAWLNGKRYPRSSTRWRPGPRLAGRRSPNRRTQRTGR